MFKVLVSDPLPEEGLTALKRVAEVDIKPKLPSNELIRIIPEYEALIVRSGTKVTAKVLEAGKRLKVVGRAGVGVDNIDIPAATSLGIVVANAPTGNIVAAAEHTVGLMFALARNIPQAYDSLRKGEWKRSHFMGTDLRRKVLGTVGLGRVATEVVRRAQGLEMEVIAYDPYISSEQAERLGVELLSLGELLARADFVTVHVPLTDSTRGLIGRDAFRKMKPTAFVLNVARGGVVDEKALIEALDEGLISGAALDVFSKEPPPSDSPLLKHPKIVVTPHLGGSTVEAQEQVARDIAEQVLTVLQGGLARYAVNMPMVPPEEMAVLGPYIELAEKLGKLAAQIGEPRAEMIEISACGEIVKYDLEYVEAAALKGFLDGVVDARVNLVNAKTIASQRHISLQRRKRAEADRYGIMLSLRVVSNGKEISLGGTVMEDGPYVVSIDGFWVSFPARGKVLLVRHHDRPGVIGKVGTLLGAHDINISFMYVGRVAPRGEAVMVMGVDEHVPDDVLDEILAMPQTYWVRQAVL